LNTNKFSVIDNKRKIGLPIPIKDEKNINLMINNFIKSNDLNSTLKNSLLAQGSQPSKLYGLPKVHKTDIPMRPVLSMIGSAQYNVAKTLVKLLKPLINNPLECKDSFEFVEKIINLEVNSESETMVSFDVVNLFTNIPLEETIQLCVDLWDELVEDKSKSMSTKALKALLEFSTKNVPFLFNDDWYMQIDGVAMGSPLAPLMASIFLQNLEQKFKNFTGELPIFYTRYVDDTFLIFKKKEDVNSFLNFINNLHPNISFTCESESNNKISFLDVLIEKKQNRFMTGVYRKPTDTGLYSTPSSFCDPKYNRNMIKGLVHRVWSLTSSFEIFDKEIDTLHNKLSINGYNKKYLNNIIKNTVESIYLKSKDKINNKNLNATEEVINLKKIYLKIPYSEGARDFKRILEKQAPVGVTIKILFLTNKISNYFSNKSKTQLGMKANLVYQYKCHKCESLYIGETNRHLRTRIAEHTQSSRKSSILDHLVKCHGTQRRVYDNDFRVLISNFDHNYERTITEALLIKFCKPSLNVQSDSSNHIRVF